MKSNSFIAASLALLVSCMAASSVLAEPIGSAVRIVNKVTGEIDQRQRELKTSDAVNQNEAIAVAADSLGELKLNDDTKLALGPGSRMVLDKFVYDPAPSAGTVSVNLLSGAFRFITGLSRKGNYQLRTPSASITVRGTVFDVYVDAAGGTWLLLLEGSVRVCNAANQCADVTNPCGVVHITPTGSLDGPQGWPGATRPISFATAFPFVVTPPSIDATPLFTRTAVELNQCGPKKPDVQKAEAPQNAAAAFTEQDAGTAAAGLHAAAAAELRQRALDALYARHAAARRSDAQLRGCLRRRGGGRGLAAARPVPQLLRLHQSRSQRVLDGPVIRHSRQLLQLERHGFPRRRADRLQFRGGQSRCRR